MTIDALESNYARLREEVEYSLRSRIPKDIKLHSLTSRVKSLASLEEKAERKGYSSPLEQTPDVVGIRAVVLFMPDIATVAEIVASIFNVVDTSDTIVGSADLSTFGYMSQHFEAYIPKTVTGPRYDELGDIRFEVQVRTLLMDAWANVSQFLGYKDELSIQRSFGAISMRSVVSSLLRTSILNCSSTRQSASAHERAPRLPKMTSCRSTSTP